MDIARGLDIQLSRTGRNEATTFAGLCAVHDAEIFAPIDTQSFDPANPEHLFLLAYRATIYELHATVAAGWAMQHLYQKRVELGLDPKEQPSDAGLHATSRMLVSYETYMYKLQFDEAYQTRQFDTIVHDAIELRVAAPTVTASALFSVDEHFNSANETVRVCLTILPLTSTRTVAILSYLPIDAPIARTHLSRVLESSGAHQMYELSRYLLNYCSNFVLSPVFYESWAPTKRAVVTEYFVRTTQKNDLAYEALDLMLFKPAA
jgi:hypothetical protein